MLRNFQVTGNEYSKILLSGDYIQLMPFHHIAELLIPAFYVHIALHLSTLNSICQLSAHAHNLSKVILQQLSLCTIRYPSKNFSVISKFQYQTQYSVFQIIDED